MSEKKQGRRRWTAGDKMRIVLLGMEPAAEVSEVCRREGLSPTQYYAWKSQLMTGAEAVFGKRQRHAPDPREARLEAQLSRMKSVIAEITAENL